MIAALFVERNGAYFGVDGVDPWDESRDARRYHGPHPVVAHPPCSRWCRLAGLVEARWGHKRGEDGGCFASALASVRKWGGVLEHPAYSDAWSAHGINAPPTGGGWVNADFVGGWTCYVEQHRYGHPAKKATWLYAHGVELPRLEWGHEQDNKCTALVSWCGNRVATGENRPRVGKKTASATPPRFRTALIAIAASALVAACAAERDLPPPPPGMTVHYDDRAPTCAEYHDWTTHCATFAVGPETTKVRIACVDAMTQPNTALSDEILTTWAHSCAHIGRFSDICDDMLEVCEALGE